MLTKRWKKLIQRIGKMELRERSFVFRVFTQKINRSTFLPGNICAASKFANETKWRKAKFWKLIPRVKQKKFVDKWKLKIKLNQVQSSSVCTKRHSSRRKPGIEKFSFHCSFFFSKKFPLCLLFLRASRNFCVTVKLLPSRHLLQADKYCTRRSILDWRKFQLLTALTPKKIFTSNTSGKKLWFHTQRWENFQGKSNDYQNWWQSSQRGRFRSSWHARQPPTSFWLGPKCCAISAFNYQNAFRPREGCVVICIFNTIGLNSGKKERFSLSKNRKILERKRFVTGGPLKPKNMSRAKRTSS